MRLLTTARITTAWAALFALVHFYWAAGGAVGMNGDVAVGTGRWLAAGDLGDDGAAGVATTAYFLLGGILFSALGRLGARASTTPARATAPTAAAA